MWKYLSQVQLDQEELLQRRDGELGLLPGAGHHGHHGDGWDVGGRRAGELVVVVHVMLMMMLYITLATMVTNDYGEMLEDDHRLTVSLPAGKLNQSFWNALFWHLLLLANVPTNQKQ